jgi:hypothetical protein
MKKNFYYAISRSRREVFRFKTENDRSQYLDFEENFLFSKPASTPCEERDVIEILRAKPHGRFSICPEHLYIDDYMGVATLPEIAVCSYEEFCKPLCVKEFIV